METALDPPRARLVPPSARYRASYVDALVEGFRRGVQLERADDEIRSIDADFEGHIAAITDQSGSVLLPDGEAVPKVPFSVHWLVEGATFIGEASIRHRLNPHLAREGGHIGYGIRPRRQRRGYGRMILALALEECRRLGLDRVLVTCQDDNIPSARIIEANGGRLEGMGLGPWSLEPVRRYWIDLG